MAVDRSVTEISTPSTSLKRTAGVGDDSPTDERSAPTPTVRTTTGAIGQDLPIDQIRPSPLNPRKQFTEGPLADLAASIREHGILEPIVVRRVSLGQYEIVAGERRFRAAQIAGLPKVPCRVLLGLSDEDHLKLALIENLQRQDLNPIEEAEGYAQLNRVAGMRQAAIAAAVNRAQPTIANRMRLLDLPADVQQLIRFGQLTPAHGVALARFSDFPAVASTLADLAVTHAWKVKDLEGGVPAVEVLANKNLAVRMTYAHPEVREACHSCPFNAYRKPAESWQQPICLKPDHFEQLQAEAEERQRQAALELAAQTRATTTAEPAAASATPSQNTEPPAPAPMTLPLLKDLPSHQHEVMSAANRSDRRRVDGCTGECPCRGRAISHDGETVVEICLDPYGRLQRLKAAQTRARNKIARTGFRALAARLTAQLASLETIGPSEIALLAAKTIEHGTWRSSRQLEPAIKRWLPAAAPAVDRLSPRPSAEALSRFDHLQVVRLALAVLLETEIAQAIEYGDGGSIDLTRWYLGEMPACPDAGGNDKRALIDTLDVEEPTAQTADDQVHEDDYPRQSDLTHSTRKLPLDSHARSGLRQGRLCERCGEPIEIVSEAHDRGLAARLNASPPAPALCAGCVAAELEEEHGSDHPFHVPSCPKCVGETA